MIKQKSLGLNIRCGDCIHYSGPKLYEDNCQALGVTASQDAPKCFQPNTVALSSIEQGLVFTLGKMLRTLDDKQARLLAYSIAAASRLIEETEFQFGQPVYVCLGKDVLSHYFKGYVMGLAYTGEHIIVSAAVESEAQSSLLLLPESIYTVTQFKRHKEKLIKARKLESFPKEASKRRLPLADYLVAVSSYEETVDALESYVPPTIDTAPVEWLDKEAAEYDYQTGKVIKQQRESIPVGKRTKSPGDVRNLKKLDVTDREDGVTEISIS